MKRPNKTTVHGWNLGSITIQGRETIRASLPPLAHRADLCDLENNTLPQDILYLSENCYEIQTLLE